MMCCCYVQHYNVFHCVYDPRCERMPVHPVFTDVIQKDVTGLSNGVDVPSQHSFMLRYSHSCIFPAFRNDMST